MLTMISAFRQTLAADVFPMELGTPQGDSFVYLAYAGALAEAPGGNSVYDIYRAKRSDGGWSTSERLSRPPSGVNIWPTPGGVSADQGYAFGNEFHVSDPRGTVDYLRSPDGSFELTGKGELADEPFAQGRYISEGGKHVLFSTGHLPEQSAWCGSADCTVKKLETNGPPEGTGGVYDREADGETHVVSLLPGDEPQKAGEQAFFKGVSQNAASVAFQIGTEESGGKVKGTLYLRVHNGQSALEETIKVAEGDPVYAGLSDDGRYLFYVTGGENGLIHRLDTSTEADEAVNPTAAGEVVNVSADGSHVYFISEEAIGGEGEAGQPNLFVWDGGLPDYITSVLPSDLVKTSGTVVETIGLPALTNWTDWVTNRNKNGVEQGPGADSSRTTADGNFLVFESRAQLTPYDNANHTEIYRWDDIEKKLSCVSCNSLAEPATADARLQEPFLIGPPVIIHNVSEDGSRVFFETSEALDEGDTNGGNDIYEWQGAGLGGGAAKLISSGTSPEFPILPPFDKKPALLSNLIMSIPPSGSDVFFTAEASLVPGAGENGTQAIYDARINGGFPVVAEAEGCAEESCKSPAGPTIGSGARPQSETSTGSNVRARHHRCQRSRKVRKGKKHRRCGHRRAGRRALASSSPEPISRDGLQESKSPSSQTEGAGTAQAGEPGAPSAVAEGDFEIEQFDVELSTPEAGAHPNFTTRLEFPHEGFPETAKAAVENIEVTLPPGLIGNPSAIPACPTGALLAVGNCPPDSQVGVARVTAGEPIGHAFQEPIFNLALPHPDGEVARFGFIAFLNYPIFIDAQVRTATDYGVTATVHRAPGLGVVVRAATTFWGDPSSDEHNEERVTQQEVLTCPLGKACTAENGERPSTIPAGERKAFLSNPSACQTGDVRVGVTSYQLPGQLFTAVAPLAPITGCTGLPFAPSFDAEPTSHEAGAPTGLKTKLSIPQHLGGNERATATVREARVTLPEGMQVAAGAANWIGTCSEEQVGYHEEVDTACPDNAKLGTATIRSPALSVPIEGTIYQRDPRPGNQLGLWLTADALGMHIKLPGSLEPDKQTGRLSAVFTDLPQVPVEEIDLNVWGGPRGPLQNPDRCGSFTTNFSFTPHSDDPAVSGQSQMQITEGCNQPFDPTLHAGVTEPVAGKYSPFVFDLTRPDGNQALRGFELKLPDGELAKIKGVPLCSDADASAANCPQGSRIGSIQATAGPGPEPFTIPEPGKPQPHIYLAGPYKDSPFSIVSEVPAQAGPFDLGTLAVRNGLDVEPETGRAVVNADPLPQFFEGVGIAYRHLHAVVDRPEFNLNPTNCREMAVTSDVTSTKGTVAHPQARFQVDGCKALKFKPKLSLKLKGGTKRADYPALTAVLKVRKGDANIAFAAVALPHSEFIAQEHFDTICTRVQFVADKCPKGSIYGKAKATTPLLDKPLSGPVYLRSSDHPLPDLVVKLGGELEIVLVGHVDSVNGGLRTRFEAVPDAPVTKFTLQMRGGKKGLFVNSTDICRHTKKASVQMRAQNGRVMNFQTRLQASGCGKKKLGKHKNHH